MVSNNNIESICQLFQKDMDGTALTGMKNSPVHWKKQLCKSYGLNRSEGEAVFQSSENL